MKILFEDSMPYAELFLSDLGHCQAFSSQSITPDALHDVDVLLVRSTTKVNAELLSKANRLKYVSTATSGSDHMDKAYLQQRGLAYGSAAGCNAQAVAEYVLSSLFVLFSDQPQAIQSKCIGIVGAGHVGSALARLLDSLAINYMLCDPPLQQQGDPRPMVDLERICQCDIISLHVPLIRDGQFPTYHMFDHGRLSQLSEHQILINACRGEVLDNQAALALFQAGKQLNLVLDVWENEPNIDFSLVPHVALATQHIAGHTLEGKVKGTYMLYEQLCQRFGLQKRLDFLSNLPISDPLQLSALGTDAFMQIRNAVLGTYNVEQDSVAFKQQVTSAQQFIYSRKHYAIRREFASMRLNAGNSIVSEAIYRLGFSVS